MKITISVVFAAAFIVSCNNNTTAPAKESMASKDTMQEKIHYAYLPINHPPDYWDRGDQKNVAMVLTSLKAFENNNLDETLVAFGDSIRFSADGFDKKMSKADFKKMLTDEWATVAGMKIIMSDYEAVVSKDKKENWVSLWYKQIMTSKTGKKDSVICMDDLKIENGKVTELDEKQRKFPVPAKQ